MQYNIYFRKDNWLLFEEEANKSGLINRLLEEHYRGVPIQNKPLPKEKVSIPKIEGLTTASELTEPEVVVPACCTKTHIRCKHWQFNDLDETWTNYITGEIREA